MMGGSKEGNDGHKKKSKARYANSRDPHAHTFFSP